MVAVHPVSAHAEAFPRSTMFADIIARGVAWSCAVMMLFM